MNHSINWGMGWETNSSNKWDNFLKIEAMYFSRLHNQQVFLFPFWKHRWFVWLTSSVSSFPQNGNATSYDRNSETIKISIWHVMSRVHKWGETSLWSSPHCSFCSRTWALNALNHPILLSSEQVTDSVAQPWKKQEKKRKGRVTSKCHKNFLYLKICFQGCQISLSYGLIFEEALSSLCKCVSQNWSRGGAFEMWNLNIVVILLYINLCAFVFKGCVKSVFRGGNKNIIF